MVTRVLRCGNSLALRIPHSLAVRAKLAEGTAVNVAIEHDRLVVTPVQHLYRLRELLKGVRRRSRHSEVRTDVAVGKEIW
jgi:antitoxin MazE